MCGNVQRGVIGAVFCRRDGRKLADYFQPWGQYGAAMSGGEEIMALIARVGFEESWHHSLVRWGQRLQQHIPPQQVSSSAINSGNRTFSGPLHSKPVRAETPQTPVCIRRRRVGSGWVCAGSTARLQSAPALLQCRLTQILKEFRDNPMVHGEGASSLIDDITQAFYHRSSSRTWQL